MSLFWKCVDRVKKKMSGEVVLAARVYRDLLKAVVKHVGKEDHKSHFLDFVKQEFRKNANSEKINLARNYTYLLNSIHSHKVQSFLWSLNHIGNAFVCLVSHMDKLSGCCRICCSHTTLRLIELKKWNECLINLQPV